jgi:hypothetical protein
MRADRCAGGGHGLLSRIKEGRALRGICTITGAAPQAVLLLLLLLYQFVVSISSFCIIGAAAGMLSAFRLLID